MGGALVPIVGMFARRVSQGTAGKMYVVTVRIPDGQSGKYKTKRAKVRALNAGAARVAVADHFRVSTDYASVENA